MASLQLALVLLLTVLASAVLDQLLPRISLPLIQIALGLAVAILAPTQITITLDPELFLVLFIAPLLYHEARIADKESLWKNRTTMLSFAIGLVVAIVLVVGFSVNLLIPAISLAAAFALGAALGPTDPIAVASVSDHADIPARQKAILKGESLINDASGIVSFQFAIAAAATGAFSLGDAVLKFLVSFFGALALGALFGYLVVRFADKVRDLGLENTMFHVALEICTPFIAYLFGEAVGVSGIILVVACGITMSLVPRDLGPAFSRMNIVSDSVWQVITFALNGIVFVMLGTQLPLAMWLTWENNGISNVDLLLWVLIITVLMHGTRFVWSLLSDGRVWFREGESRTLGQRVRSALITTLAGSKGTITLAITFSIPMWIPFGSAMVPFPNRDLLIFLSSGVILLSLLLATFIVPLLAPRKVESEDEKRRRDLETRIDIFRVVIEELTARQTPETRIATAQVIARYNDRIARSKAEDNIEDESDTQLRIKVLGMEEDYVLGLIEADEIDPVEGYQYLSRLARIETMLKRDRRFALRVSTWFRRVRTVLRKMWMRFRNKLPGETHEDSRKAMRDIQLRTSHYIVHRLRDGLADSEFPTEKVSELMLEYQRTVGLLQSSGPSVTAIVRASAPDLEVTRMGLRIELEQIQQAYEEGRLSRAGAQAMRENVYLMQVDLEDYL